MVSKTTLAKWVGWLHIVWVCCLLVSSLCLFVGLALKNELIPVLLGISGVMGITTFLAQLMWGGACPFTLLEDALRKGDGEAVEEGRSCVVDLCKKWFGITIQASHVYWSLVVILMLNVAAVVALILLR